MMLTTRSTHSTLYSLVTMMLMVSLILVGCSTDPTESTANEVKEFSADDSIHEIKLNVWVQAKPTEKYRLENIKEAAAMLNERYEEEGKAERIVIEGMIDDSGWADYKQKFVLAYESNQAPDIILSGHEDVAPWSKAGYILALDEYIDRFEQFSDIFPNLWNSVTYKGERWGIPQDTEARPLYYEKQYLRDLGWSDADIDKLPEAIRAGEFTLSDLLELAKEAQDQGLVRKGYGFYHRPTQGPDFYMYYYAFGGEMQDPETGKLILDEQALLKKYQFFHDTVSTYETTVNNLIGTGWDIWHRNVTNKEAFFSQGGTWMVAEWKDKYNLTEEDWESMGYALIPAGEAGMQPVTLSHPLVYMITAQSEHPEIALELLALATNAEFNTRHAVESAHLGILQSQEDYPDYVADPFLKDVTYMLNYTHYLPNHEQFGAYDEAVFRGLTAVTAGQLTPEEAVETVISELERTLGDEVIIR